MKKKTLILSIIIIVVILAIAGYLTLREKVQTSVSDVTANWKIFVAIDGLEFKYPENFSGATWRAQYWPPLVLISDTNRDAVKSCGAGEFASVFLTGQAGSPKNIVLGGRKLEAYKLTDVGAGQLYSDFCYVFNANNKYYSINFLIHSTNGCGNGNCGPYCGTANEKDCKNFDMQKEIVQPIEKIVSTLNFIK